MGVSAAEATAAARRLVGEVIEAQGGLALWRGLEAIELTLDISGALFFMKRVPRRRGLRVRVSLGSCRTELLDYPFEGYSGIYEGNEVSRIATADGTPVAERAAPRRAFRRLAKSLAWDELDFIYFSGYALWNYLNAPFLFLYEGVESQELSPLRLKSGETWRRLQVTFPDTIPTHCPRQVFYFDEDRLLRRLDYTPRVIGRWARAAHFCDQHQSFDGLMVPTRRRVYPRALGPRVLRFPTLVALDIKKLKLVGAERPE